MSDLGFVKYTRRQYLTAMAMMNGANVFSAVEAVASVALEHPEWDMDDEKTWAEWVSIKGGALS